MRRAPTDPTAKDLEARGFRLVCIGRMRDYENGGWKPPAYTLRRVDGDPTKWYGLIEGVPRDPSQSARRHYFGRQQPSWFVARPMTKRGEIAQRPLPDRFSTTVAAAHALVDRMEAER
jgi:hypothetical protein